MATFQRPDSDIEASADKLLNAAKQNGIVLRLMGACAIKRRCPKFNFLYEKMKRRITDVDFVTYGRFIKETRTMLLSFGYTADDKVNAFQPTRHLYYGKDLMIDVFIDKLEMCHTVEFKGRLEIDSDTLSLADLLLCKMQIVQLNEKDIKDSIVLLREHEVGDVDGETVNAKRIANALASDWGFTYTFLANLKKVKDAIPNYDVLDENDRTTIASRLDELTKAVEDEPKTTKWKMRAKIGTKRKWYTDVENLRT